MAELSAAEKHQGAAFLEMMTREAIGMSMYLSFLKDMLHEKAPMEQLMAWYAGRVISLENLLTAINELHLLLQIPRPIPSAEEDEVLLMIALHDADPA